MELFTDILFDVRAVTEPIDRILNAFKVILISIFTGSTDGFFRMLVSTILNNALLYVGLVLVICGFVIGILKRLITV